MLVKALGVYYASTETLRLINASRADPIYVWYTYTVTGAPADGRVVDHDVPQDILSIKPK